MEYYECAVCGEPLPEKENTFRLTLRTNRTRGCTDEKYRAAVCYDCSRILLRHLFKPPKKTEDWRADDENPVDA